VPDYLVEHRIAIRVDPAYETAETDADGVLYALPLPEAVQLYGQLRASLAAVCAIEPDTITHTPRV
jgi:protoporphyrinogen oxidase